MSDELKVMSEAGAIDNAPMDETIDSTFGEPEEASTGRGLSLEGLVAIAGAAGTAGAALWTGVTKIYHSEKVQARVSEIKRKHEIRKNERAEKRKAHKDAVAAIKNGKPSAKASEDAPEQPVPEPKPDQKDTKKNNK